MPRFLNVARFWPLGAFAIILVLSGCGDDSLDPVEEPGPDLTTVQGAIEIREVFYPGVPQTQADADRLKFAVYATKGIRGLYVSEDDTAALVNAGFWEEDLDVDYLWHRMQELQQRLLSDTRPVRYGVESGRTT